MFGRIALQSAGASVQQVVGFIYSGYSAGNTLTNVSNVAEDASGNLFIPIPRDSSSVQIDVLKFDAAYATQWQTNITGWASTISTSYYTIFGCDASDNVYLYDIAVGSGFSYSRPIVTKILASDGSISTSKMYSRGTNTVSGGYMDVVPHIASDGSIYIAERINEKTYLLKLDSSMSFQWSQYFTSTFTGDSSTIEAIDTDASGNVIVAGQTQTTTTVNAAMLAKFDASGNLLWNAAYSYSSSSAAPNYLQYMEAACFDDTGSFIYAVLRNNNTGSTSVTYNTAILKINASSGAIVWTRRLSLGVSKIRPTPGGINFDANTGLVTVFFPASWAYCVTLDSSGNFNSSVSIRARIGADDFPSFGFSSKCTFSQSGAFLLSGYFFDSVLTDRVVFAMSVPASLNVSGTYNIPDSGNNGVQIYFADKDVYTTTVGTVYKFNASWTWGTATANTSALAIESTQTPSSGTNMSLIDGFIDVVS